VTDVVPEASEETDPLRSELCDGWVITSRLNRHAKQTGRAFSVGIQRALADFGATHLKVRSEGAVCVD
jgi:hypothetical protein